MAADFPSLLGHVDECMEQRASLLSALRAKLDSVGTQQLPLPSDDGPVLLSLAEDSEEVEVPTAPALPVIDVDDEEPSPSAPAGDAFSDVMAQLDRGLDARQQMIDALKAQLSKSSALPKAKLGPRTWSQVPRPALASPPVAASGYGAVGAVAVAVTQPHLLQRPQLVQQPPQMPQQVPQQMPQQQVQAVPQLQSFPSPGISNPGMPTGMTMPVPVAMPMGMPIGEPPLKRPRSAGAVGTVGAGAAMPFPLRAPEQQDFAVKDAEQAALAARKAQMLRNLGANVSEQSGSQAMPQAGFTPSVPEPPPGTSPEEFEAYRQQCWREYYQWCKIWQKYYDQSKGKAKGRGAGHPPGSNQVSNGKGHAGPQAAHGKGRSSAFAPQAPRPSVEDDIHSQLLGL
ncbi:unnamed protein product [Symbiodinium natans]|uniref:Uncharacterized protein n=1 Tax=Symbiodinium natans TaxID=878477 RepID=A0A812JEI9_9DINO|nr:unnamed protein product [Symbiodinium natans]